MPKSEKRCNDKKKQRSQRHLTAENGKRTKYADFETKILPKFRKNSTKTAETDKQI